MLRDERLMLMIAVLYAANPHCTNVPYALDKALEIEGAVKEQIREENLCGQTEPSASPSAPTNSQGYEIRSGTSTPKLSL
jgi:hypothetical protein